MDPLKYARAARAAIAQSQLFNLKSQGILPKFRNGIGRLINRHAVESMHFLKKLFEKGEDPLPVIDDPQLGRLKWSG
jgi:hypothetical protein